MFLLHPLYEISYKSYYTILFLISISRIKRDAVDYLLAFEIGYEITYHNTSTSSTTYVVRYNKVRNGSFRKKLIAIFLKLDTATRKHIIKWLDTYIKTPCDAKWGKPLKEDGTYLKYIVRKYRILFKVNNQEFIVLAIKETKHKK